MVRFFDVYDPTTLEKVGQVKSDPYRKALKWTALDKDGRRIKDCASREDAETAVRDKHGHTKGQMHFKIHRADMTEDGDYHSYSCEGWEGQGEEGECDYSAGCNGPHPYLVSDDTIYCGYCAFKEAILEGSGLTMELDPETTWEDDNLYEIISDLLWGRGYLSGMEAHQATEAYKTAYERFRDGTWDEATEGPFWKWSDEDMFPFLVEAKVKLLKELKGLVTTTLQSSVPDSGETQQYEMLGQVFDDMVEASKDFKMVSRAEAAMDMLKRRSVDS